MIILPKHVAPLSSSPPKRQGTVELVQFILHEIESGNDKFPRTVVHDLLSSHALPPPEKTLIRISDETSTILAGALETTAHTLRNIIYYVYSDPHILSTLRAELAPVFAQLPSITNSNPAEEEEGEKRKHVKWSDLERIPYLNAVVTEGLRLAPGQATRAARIAPDRELVYQQTDEQQGQVVREWIIPRNTPVSMTVLLMHMDPKVYPDPHRFEPERWLRMDPDVRKRVEARSFGPFSRGTRNCLGLQ